MMGPKAPHAQCMQSCTYHGLWKESGGPRRWCCPRPDHHGQADSKPVFDRLGHHRPRILGLEAWCPKPHAARRMLAAIMGQRISQMDRNSAEALLHGFSHAARANQHFAGAISIEQTQSQTASTSSRRTKVFSTPGQRHKCVQHLHSGEIPADTIGQGRREGLAPATRAQAILRLHLLHARRRLPPLS